MLSPLTLRRSDMYSVSFDTNIRSLLTLILGPFGAQNRLEHPQRDEFYRYLLKKFTSQFLTLYITKVSEL